jgi:uncharacterized protein (TIGR02594 family)
MSLLAVMESRLGIQEVPGKKHNPIIVGWFEDIGHAEVVDDETSWCSVCCASAAKEAGLPMPPVNVRMMARSWLTWGVGVPDGNAKPGDVAIWPRGDPKGWQGHVNVVKEVRRNIVPGGNDIQVRCIGGNQSGLKGGDAVTLSGWQDASKALGFRRPVEATVPALRSAGSTEIRKGDQVQNAGWLVTVIPATIAAVKELLEPVQVPEFATLPEALTWYETVMRGLNAIGGLVLAYPWLAGTAFLGLVCILVGRRLKAKRLAKHAAGIPIAAEVEAAHAG